MHAIFSMYQEPPYLLDLSRYPTQNFYLHEDYTAGRYTISPTALAMLRDDELDDSILNNYLDVICRQNRTEKNAFHITSCALSMWDLDRYDFILYPEVSYLEYLICLLYDVI